MNLNKSTLRKNLFYCIFILSFLPFISLLFDLSVYQDLLPKLANIFGYFGALILFWQFFLGIRGVVKRLNPDYDWAIKIHTYLGIYGSIFIFLHPIFLMIHRNNSIESMIFLNFSTEYQSFVSYGKLAFFLFMVLWVTSTVARKSMNYRSWLYIHYISYPLIFFTLLHPFKIGSYLIEFPLIYFYWISLCILMIVFIFYKILDILNLSFNKFRVIEVKNFPGDTYTILYEPVTSPFKDIKPGQYFYIKMNNLGEAHPFSILEYDEFSNKLKFGIKKLGKYSTLLANAKVGDIHYLDGPFGEFTIEGQNDEPKVILAGGIGITPFFELVQQYGNNDTFLFYANKNLDTALYRDKFKELLKSNYYDFIDESVPLKSNVFCELISANKIKELLKNSNISSLNYFICGSPGFTKSMINCLKSLSVPRNKIYIEEFEY
jgi:predicted ferric reductase